VSLQTVNENAPPRPPRPPVWQVLREAPVTSLIFAACVLVFLAALVVGNNNWNNATLIHFGAVGRRSVWAGQYWRLFTAMFLHIGPLHLVCNLWFGFRLCAQAEKAIGPWRFLLLYLGSGVVGSAVSVLGREAVSAGASGALFGVVGWMLVALRAQFGSWRAFVQHPAIRQQLIWIGGWFVLGAFIGFDNYAHGGGLLFGALYTWALLGYARARGTGRVRMAVALGVGALLVAASLHPLPFQDRGIPEDIGYPEGD
jgi:membrane associated rhomboid family serine protease